jgi:hypothetical protein
MSSIAISGIVFGCVFGGALLSMYLGAILPKHHLSTDSKGIIQLGTGLIATMAALVLGLLIASAKTSYDTRKRELVEVSATIGILDRALAHYGPEAKEARGLLRRSVITAIEQMGPQESARPAPLEPTTMGAQGLVDKIQELAPQNDAQRSLQAQAFSLAVALGHTRWLMFEQSGGSIPMPLLAVLVFWLTLLFVSFGLYAPANATVVMTPLVCALSVAGAIFLILELDLPFEGLMQVPSTPLRNVLTHLAQ